MKNNIISITSIREREFAHLWNIATPEQRLHCLAMYVHKYNDKKITKEEKKVIDKVLNYDELSTLYYPTESDPVKNSCCFLLLLLLHVCFNLLYLTLIFVFVQVYVLSVTFF